MARKKFTKKQIVKAIEGSGGIISKIAQRMGVTWNTAKRYVELYEDTRIALSNEQEAILDLCEVKVIKKIEDGDNSMIKFYLMTKGKDRGFVIRKELTGNDGNAIEVDFTS